LSGYCKAGENCVCGGDVPAVREGCYYWSKESPRVGDSVPINFDSSEPQPSITNPLSAYGALVRVLRIVAGVTLMDHAKTLAVGPAALSNLEFGRANVDRSMVIKTAIFFAENGVEDTEKALAVAASKSNYERLRETVK
jgi:hypothetical protein